MSIATAIENYVTKYAESKWLWRQLSDDDKYAIKCDLMEIMDDNCQCNLPCHFEEYVHNADRQFSLIANVFLPVESLGKVIRPFANKEYTLFFSSLPYELRSGRKFYREACKEMFPDIFSIGTQSQIYDADSLLGKIEKIVSLLISRASYAIFTAYKRENCHS